MSEWLPWIDDAIDGATGTAGDAVGTFGGAALRPLAGFALKLAALVLAAVLIGRAL